MPNDQHPVRNAPRSRAGVIIELVGPGGSGKTTLSSNIRQQGSVHVLKVPSTKGLPALLAGLAAASRLAARHRLGLSGWLTLARNCAAVEQAMHHTAGLDGIWIVDEGPVRCLRERRCEDGRDLEAWADFAQSVVARLADRAQDVEVVILDLDAAVRKRRYEERTERENAERKVSNGLRNWLGFVLDQRLRAGDAPAFLGGRVDAMLSSLKGVTIKSFSCRADETPRQMADRFSREIVAPHLAAATSAPIDRTVRA